MGFKSGHNPILNGAKFGGEGFEKEELVALTGIEPVFED